jgi:hypothetical protein
MNFRNTMAGLMLLLSFTHAAQAAAVLSLKGSTSAVKYASDAELRLSVLSYDDSASAAAVIKRLSEYQQNGDHAEFERFLRAQQTRGYVFSKEATGYSIKYAWQDPEAAGQRMVFVVTPALKKLNPYMWKTPNEEQLPFTVLELRMEGEKAVLKTSLDSPVEINADRLQLQDFNAAEPFAVLEDNRPYYLRESS